MPASEGEHPPRGPAAEHQPIRLGERLRVAVCGRDHRHDPGTGRKAVAAEVDRAVCHPGDRLDGAVVPKQLVNRCRDLGRRRAAQRGQLIRIPKQGEQAVGDQVHRVVVAVDQ